MEASLLPPPQARLKLAVLSKQAEARNSYEFHSEMKELGLPDEVIEILERILRVTSKVAGKVICIGKIIVIKLLEYVVKHPFQVAGLAAGLASTYALGIALHGIFAWVSTLAEWPIIGSLLSKLALIIAHLCKTVFVPLMVILPVVGITVGEMADKKYPEISASFHKVSTDFFELLGQILNSIKDELSVAVASS
jgi:uncharacterized membrane protein